MPALAVNSLTARRQRRGHAGLLGRYLGARWLMLTLLLLVGLGAFIALVNALEALNFAADRPQTTALDAALMSLLRLPEQLMELLPFAVLLGTLVWLQQLKSSREWTAMAAAGLPVRRKLTAPLVTCLLLGVVAVGVGNPLSAAMLKRFDRWESSISPPAARGLLTERGSLWLRQDVSDTSVFLYGRALAGGLVTEGRPVLNGATLFMFDPNYNLTARLDALTATLEPGLWRLQNVTLMQPGHPIRSISGTVLPTDLTPSALAASLAPPETLNAVELYRLQKILTASGWPATAHVLALAQLAALPFFMLALLLLAIPTGLKYQRHGGLARALGFGLALGFAFFLLRNWIGAYALAGRLDPWLAAFAPVLLGFLLAAFLFTLVRED